MVKIISTFIYFLNTFRILLFKFECFLLKFLPNDPVTNSSSDAYRRFKVHNLPIIEPQRNTFNAIDAFYSVLREFKEIPEKLEFVVDGNPIYKAAQQYFQLKRIFLKSHR